MYTQDSSSIITDRIVYFLDKQVHVTLHFADVTQLVKQALAIHSPVAPFNQYFAECITASVLMSSFLNFKESVNIKIKLHANDLYNNDIGTFVAESNPSGYTRAYTQINTQLKSSDIGKISINTMKVNPNKAAPYLSLTELKTSSITKAIDDYYLKSQQTTSFCKLFCYFENDTLINAGGVILQQLPACERVLFDKYHQKLNDLNIQPQEFAKLTTNDGMILENLFDNLGKPVYYANPEFQCPCSKETFRVGLAKLSPKDLLEMVKDADKNAEPIEAVCQYCHQAYQFTAEELLGTLTDETRN